MSPDRQLIDTIKHTFAEYSSAQLQEIAQATDAERWSAEALTAARELLRDRDAGDAQEPRVAREPVPDPPPGPDPYSLASVFGLVMLSADVGYLDILRYDRGEQDELLTDQPIAFGSKIAWLALGTTDTDAVASALGLREVQPAQWAEGIEAAHRSSMYITPPLGDWTLAVGAALFPPERAEAFVKPLLERLSRQFGDAQYFCTHRDVPMLIWARARKGRLVRGYGWRGPQGLTLWDEGTPTREERDLGFRFLDGRQPPSVEPADPQDPASPDERCVMQLAYLWSIDPMSLDEEFKDPATGLLVRFEKR